MNLRLKTNLDIELKLNELQSSLQLSSKAAVMRISIAYSLKMQGDPRLYCGQAKKYDIRKQNGAEYNRYTIFGDDEFIYRCAMEEQANRCLSDDEFYPELTFFHIERGISELYADFKLVGNREKLLIKIIGKQK